MSFEVERDDLIDEIKTWVDTPIAWDGLNGAPFTRTSTQAYVRPTIENDGQFVAGLRGASEMYRSLVMLKAQFFFAKGTGDAAMAQRVDGWTALWRGKTIGSLTHRGRIVVNWVGEQEKDPGWFQVNVFVPFYRDESF